LSPLGRKQALLAVDSLGAVDAIVSSSLMRALDTARIISEGLGVGPVLLEPDLQERDAGEWQGLTRVEIEERWPGYLAEHRRPPGYEQDEPLVERVLRALHRVCSETQGDDILVVTHGGVINALERHCGVPWERVPNLGARWFEWRDGGVVLGERVELIDHSALTMQDAEQL
jgi:probable phosphoglycerate mutase